MENESTRQFTWKQSAWLTLCGIIVYWLLGVYVRIPTGHADSTVLLRYPVATLLAAALGPVCGTLIGFIGQCAVDIHVHSALYWPTIICSGLLGTVMGFARGKRIRVYTLFCILANVIVWAVVKPPLDVVLRGKTLYNAFYSGALNAVSNTLTCVIISQIVIASSMKQAFRKIVCVVVIIDAVLLFSYGRRGFGNVVVYIIAMLFCLYEILGSLLRRGAKSRVRLVLRVVLAAFAAVFLISSAFLLINGYSAVTDGTEQAIIVLGAGLDGEEPCPILRSRLDKALEYANAHPEISVIVSGGQGEGEVISEAEAMKRYLVRAGLSEDRILMEDQSATTEENFAFSRERYPELERIIYVTNEYHSYRAGMVAQAAGYENAHHLSANTSFWSLFPSLCREIPSIIKMALRQSMNSVKFKGLSWIFWGEGNKYLKELVPLS